MECNRRGTPSPCSTKSKINQPSLLLPPPLTHSPIPSPHHHQVRSAILLGSGVPAVMYLTWNAMVLGNVAPGSLGPQGLDLYSLMGAGE